MAPACYSGLGSVIFSRFLRSPRKEFSCCSSMFRSPKRTKLKRSVPGGMSRKSDGTFRTKLTRRRSVECHERWHYDSATKVQTLVGTISFCPSCHEATHFGLARVRGRDGEALQHLVRTNGWTESFAWQHVLKAMEAWKQRSEIEWLLDARWLLDFVPLTEGTKTKILNHATGLGERTVMDWQDDVIVDQARECSVRRSAD